MKHIYLLPLFSCTLLLACQPIQKKSNESTLNSVFENEMTKIEWRDLLSQNEKRYLVYVYSETCGHCIKLKPLMESYVKKSNFKVYSIEFNKDLIPIGDDEKKCIGLNDINLLFIKGTPTLFEVLNGRIIDSICGYSAISTYIFNN
ncbi:MAG: thioredoxin family protein [Bacilli bacterium]|nr:thioredoxin family protein [Bacilli bacterium]